MSSKLFQPMKLGNIELQNRVVLAPLTRYRASDEHIPLPYVPEYYAQRASSPGTLLITEATVIAPQASGFGNVPGVWSQTQIDAWKKVTKAVHEKKSFIYCQLWAIGRVALTAELRRTVGEGAKVMGPSDIPATGGDKPSPLSVDEIKEYTGWFAQAAKNAIEAGFDGVEVHGANGYLIDQFLQDITNNRGDSYGESIENRARFGLEVMKAVVEAVGADRSAIRISPFSQYQEMKMDDPIPTFSYFTSELKKFGLAYLHVSDFLNVARPKDAEFVLKIWGNESAFLINGGFDPASAKETVDEIFKDSNVGVVFGRQFISNPDLVFRMKKGLELSPYDHSTFYAKKQEKGYADYPFSPEFIAAQS